MGYSLLMPFQTSQYLKGCDGTYKGKQQPIGEIRMIRGIDRKKKCGNESNGDGEITVLKKIKGRLY